MPEATGVGSMPTLNLLYDPRAVRFGTAHYQVLLQHWTQVGWVKQWRLGKAVVFEVVGHCPGHGGRRQPMCDLEGCSIVWEAVEGGGGGTPPLR